MSGPATSSVAIQPVLSPSDFISSVQSGDPDTTNLAAYGAALGDVLEYLDDRERALTIIELIEAITIEFANNPAVRDHLLENLAELLTHAEGDLRKAGMFLQGGRPKVTLFAPDDKMRAQVLEALAIQQKATGRDGPFPMTVQPTLPPPAHAPILTLPGHAGGDIREAMGGKGRGMRMVDAMTGGKVGSTESTGTATGLKIEEGCPLEEVEALHGKLLEYERRFCTPEFTKPINHNFLVKGENGELVGGVDFVIAFGTSYVRNIWVREDYRGQGIASELMGRVENFSREHGAVYVALDTMDFEAPDFYKKIGYEIEHERKSVFGEHSQFSFRKKL